MKRNHILLALGFHGGLLVLASTKFSVLSWVWGDLSWTWEYSSVCYRNGWGHRYQSDYDLPVVLAYVGAYLLGVVAYKGARRQIPGSWRALAEGLSWLGLASFLVEGSHWVLAHHLSLVAICPAASLLLAVVAIVQVTRAGSWATGSGGASVVGAVSPGA